MLRRLDMIKGCGIFEDFHWDMSLPELTRINVFYGNNGSGKTSLARALDGLRHDDVTPDGFNRVSFTVEDGINRRTTAGQDDPVFDRVLVFDEDYVDRNHRFKSGNPDMAAVLTLGQRTAEADARLEKARALIKEKTSERDKTLKASVAASKQLDKVYERISTSVVSDNRRAGGRYQSRGSYSTGAVKTAFAGRHDEWTMLGTKALAADKQLVASDNRASLKVGSFSATIDTSLSTRASTALAKTPVTVLLDTLRDHPEASEWVQEGQQYHARFDKCIYCGQQLSDKRKRDIERHFSDEVSALQADLQKLIDELNAAETEVDNMLARIQESALVFEDLRGDYETAEKAVRATAAELKKWIVGLRVRLESKNKNVLLAVDTVVAAPPVADGSVLEVARDAHNKRVAEHDALVRAAAKAVELHHLKSEEANVAKLTSSRDDAQKQADDLGAEIQSLNTEIAALEDVQGDPTPSADVLTRQVGQLLGRSELTFEPIDGRYAVTRDGEPALGLSVGERTAITLVHFLESVARFDTSKGKPIVVIDDPVSSLDSDIFMGISTYIWSETVAKGHVEQVILLTHNFELFRQWDVQLESLHKNGRMKTLYPAGLFEIGSKHVVNGEGKARRRPVISVWPPSPDARKKVRSTYHHAFIAVAKAKKDLEQKNTLERRLDAQLLFPNVIRRMLETFIAFKRPEWVGDFTAMMRDSAKLLEESGYVGDADALRLRLTRYAHASSHAETPDTDVVVSPDEVSTAIVAVFTFMNQIDGPHFRGLCEVLGLDPAELLQEPTEVLA